MAAKDLTKEGRPTLSGALRALDDVGFDSKLEIRRVELQFLASGECTYRVTPAGEGEPEGGVLNLRG